jgi:hypothetical protein
MGFADSSTSPWFASGTVTSPEARYALAAAFAKATSSAVNAETGVVPASSGPFTPSSNGTALAPSVSVAPGQCVVQTAVGGTYVCTLPAAVTVTVDTPLPSGANTRKDVLCARVLDSEAGDGLGSTGRLRLETVTGTAGVSPSTPSTPSGYLALYVITVNSSGALTLSDVRSYTRGVGGARFVQTGDTRDGSHTGDLRIFATGQIDAWLSSAWITIVAPAVWTQTTVAYTYAGNGGSVAQGTVGFGAAGTSIVRYKRTGNDLTVSYQATWSGNNDYSGGVGQIWTVLPNSWVTPAGRKQWLTCELWARTPDNSWSGDFVGQAYVAAASNVVQPYFQTNVGDVPVSMLPYKIADSIGVPGHSVPYNGSGRFAEGGSINIYGTIELAS